MPLLDHLGRSTTRTAFLLVVVHQVLGWRSHVFALCGRDAEEGGDTSRGIVTPRVLLHHVPEGERHRRFPDELRFLLELLYEWVMGIADLVPIEVLIVEHFRHHRR